MIRDQAARARVDRAARPVSFGEAYYGPRLAVIKAPKLRARFVVIVIFMLRFMLTRVRIALDLRGRRR